MRSIRFFAFEEIGVDLAQTEADTCVIEHCISEESFIGLREAASGVRGVQYGKYHDDD